MPAARVIRSKSVSPRTQRTSGFPLLPYCDSVRYIVQRSSRDMLKKNDKKL